MSEERTSFEWGRVPGLIAEGTRDLFRAGLGVVDVVERRGEQLVDALRGDRAAMVENLQERGSRAIDTMQHEANRVFRDLVDRGEKLQAAGGKRVESTVKHLSERPREMADAIEKTVERVMEATLHRLDVPTRREVDRLSRRVERLTHEVERLVARLNGGGPGRVTLLEVVAIRDVWAVRDIETGEMLFEAETKADAVRFGRERAHASVPAELRILKQDGTVQDTAHYA